LPLSAGAQNEPPDRKRRSHRQMRAEFIRIKLTAGETPALLPKARWSAHGAQLRPQRRGGPVHSEMAPSTLLGCRGVR
jgi:hypothetical protein